MTDDLFARSRKKNLIVVRAGGRSLHRDWLDLPYADRQWDLLVSYYDRAAYEAHEAAPGVEAVFVPGGKWNGLFQTLRAMPGHTRYSHVWLPDDDIATTGAAINRIFDEAAEYDLAVCQPSLTEQSFFSHFVFMQCSAFRLRYANYIEIMVPCLRADILAQALPLFENTMSGYGLDYLWCRMPGAGPYKSAVLDTVAVYHTRPVGSALRSSVAQATGGTSEDEERVLVSRFGNVPRTVPLVYAGIACDGENVTGRFAAALRMSGHYWSRADEFRDPALARRKTLQLLKRQIIKTLNLDPLPAPRDPVHQDAAA